MTLAGDPVELTPTEFDRLLRRVWSTGNLGNQMHLHRMLGKGGSNPSYNFAEPWMGYWTPEGEEP